MKKLILLREQAQLTQAEAAKLIECERSSICRWECGVASPNARFLPTIARVYGVKIADLFTEEELKAKPYEM